MVGRHGRLVRHHAPARAPFAQNADGAAAGARARTRADGDFVHRPVRDTGGLLPHPRPTIANYPFQPLLAWLGAVVLVLALLLFFHTHRRLGRFWSVTLEIRRDHGLVTDGIYRFVRHPMYSAYFLWALSQALLLPNWIAGPAGLVGFGTLFAFRVRREERMMLATFGDAYAAYAARTKRIIPGVF